MPSFAILGAPNKIKAYSLTAVSLFVYISNYDIATNALIKVLQKMRPDEDCNKLVSETFEISKKALADKYGSDFLAILEEMEKLGLKMEGYIGTDQSPPMKQAITKKVPELDIQTVRMLNEKLSKFLDKVFYDPEYDVGLPG